MAQRNILRSYLLASFCVAAVCGQSRAIVVSDPLGAIQAPPWFLAGRFDSGFVNHSGVANIIMLDSSGVEIGGCTGSLLSGGQHVLTAAHCITEAATEVDSVRIDWELPVFNPETGQALPGLIVPLSLNSSQIHIHQAWQNNPASAAAGDRDLAVINLGTTAPNAVPRYDILRDTSDSELSSAGDPVIGVKVGFGFSGFNGGGPPLVNNGLKHWGLNEWDQIFEGEAGLLHYDFDSGSASTNSFGSLGLGDVEGAAGKGDSGGPTFILNQGTPRIAGVSTFSINGDILDTDAFETNGSTWGDTAVDVRVSDPLNQNFIDLLVNHDRLLGDTNNDGELDSLDIDTLFDARGGAADPWFDLNLDGVVDNVDVDDLVREILQTEYGDAGLDGRVDILDFSALSTGTREDGTTWAQGDFNGDDVVDTLDFSTLSGNFDKFIRDTSSFDGSTSFTGIAAVPEPATVGLLMVGAVGFARQRRA